jgi:hypothetical protein
MDIVNERKLTRGGKVATLDRWRQSVLERIGTAEHGTRTCKHAPGQAQTLNLIEQAKQLLTRADLRPPVPTER